MKVTIPHAESATQFLFGPDVQARQKLLADARSICKGMSQTARFTFFINIMNAFDANLAEVSA